MLPSFLGRPSGRETGTFWALDLGGTNFRVYEVELKGQRTLSLNACTQFAIPAECIHGTGEMLFNFIASELESFLRQRDIISEVDLGFVFSFPVQQSGPVKGVLVEWTKDFTASGVVGNDVVGLLKAAFLKKNMPKINVLALVNDTVATLLGEAYTDADADAGLILGTGTNACYAEQIGSVQEVPALWPRGQEMIINTEWGGFGCLEQNEYDVTLDQRTSRPQTQILEKMVSGLYLSRLIKLVLNDCVKKGLILDGRDKNAFLQMDFDAGLVSGIEGDTSKNLAGVNDLLREKDITTPSLEDRETIKEVCRIVSNRAARISSAGIGAILTRMDPEINRNHTVAVDGALFRRHPFFKPRMEKALHELLGPRAGNIRLNDVQNGSGIGGAVAAAVAGGGVNCPA